MFANRIAQTLHEEHRMTIALMERIERMLGGRMPAADNPDATRLLRDLVAGVSDDTPRHFDFEESELFTLLEARGDGAIGAHLTDEHTAMRPLAQELAASAHAALAGGFDQASWKRFQQVGGEFCERMLVHVQKEEMALLPLIDVSMDGETEMRLYEAYTALD